MNLILSEEVDRVSVFQLISYKIRHSYTHFSITLLVHQLA